MKPVLVVAAAAAESNGMEWNPEASFARPRFCFVLLDFRFIGPTVRPPSLPFENKKATILFISHNNL